MVALHGIGGRGDLPVPLWLAIYAASAAVVVSFFALAAFWSRPRFEPGGTGVRLGTVVTRVADARLVRWLLKATGLAMLGALVAVAWWGSDSAAANPAPTWLYVWGWVGVVPLSLLLGPVWRLANPLRTLSAGIRRLLRRPDGYRELAWAGPWPATAGLLVFVWLELASPDSSQPRAVAAFVTAYAVLEVAAGVVFGSRWFAVGDTFEVYAELLARLSPWGRDADRRIVLRNPLAGLAGTTSSSGLVAFCCLLLGSTGFDGVSRWSVWSGATGELGTTGRVVAHTLGLLLVVALVTGVFVVAARAPGTARTRPGAVGSGGLAGTFAHALVPIAIGYAVAHYFSLAVFQGQAGLLLATDPFGRGRDLLGLAGTRIDYAVVSTATIAAVQITAIVLGHMLGVVAAHDRATVVFRRRQLRRAQYPMLVAMVTFTAGGIALVAGS